MPLSVALKALAWSTVIVRILAHLGLRALSAAALGSAASI
jgi:hypothetical protein